MNFNNFFRLFGLNDIYIIMIESINFKKKLEYIFKPETYDIIVYIAPTRLPVINLICFTCNFKMIAVANNII